MKGIPTINILVKEKKNCIFNGSVKSTLNNTNTRKMLLTFYGIKIDQDITMTTTMTTTTTTTTDQAYLQIIAKKGNTINQNHISIIICKGKNIEFNLSVNKQ